jgi:hypothetical protein
MSSIVSDNCSKYWYSFKLFANSWLHTFDGYYIRIGETISLRELDEMIMDKENWDKVDEIRPGT